MKLPETSERDPVNPTSPARVECCEACGASFGCGASLEGCWCSEIKLTDTQLSSIRSRYERCLCRPCLERLAESDIENVIAMSDGRVDGRKEK